jgi:hypothetical protein
VIVLTIFKCRTPRRLGCQCPPHEPTAAVPSESIKPEKASSVFQKGCHPFADTRDGETAKSVHLLCGQARVPVVHCSSGRATEPLLWQGVRTCFIRKMSFRVTDPCWNRPGSRYCDPQSQAKRHWPDRSWRIRKYKAVTVKGLKDPPNKRESVAVPAYPTERQAAEESSRTSRTALNTRGPGARKRTRAPSYLPFTYLNDYVRIIEL